jgi:ribosomal protein S15P/S13E
VRREEHSRKRKHWASAEKSQSMLLLHRPKAVQTHSEEHRQLKDVSGKNRLPKEVPELELAVPSISWT